MDLIYKIIVAIVAIVITGTYLRPLLLTFYPPFGTIILIILFLAIVLWMMGKI